MAAAGYAALVVLNRAKYGDSKRSADAAKDPVLDQFIPNPEVAEHHEIVIQAPVDVVMATAKSLELMTSPVIRAIFRARERALGGEPDTRPHPTTLYDKMLSIGWVVLSEQAGHEIVFGAVTQPWLAAPTFRSIPADRFREFCEPGFVKSCGPCVPTPLATSDPSFIRRPASAPLTRRPESASGNIGRSSPPE